jgi:hypothetical protein
VVFFYARTGKFRYVVLYCLLCKLCWSLFLFVDLCEKYWTKRICILIQSYLITKAHVCLHKVTLWINFLLQAGTNFASEIVATILIGLHMSETCSRFSLNKETEKHVVNPITCGDCICPTHNLFGIKFNAQLSCNCGKCSGEYLYTTLFHKLDAGSLQTTKVCSTFSV